MPHVRSSVKLESFACLTMSNLPTKFHSCRLIISGGNYLWNSFFDDDSIVDSNFANSPCIYIHASNSEVSCHFCQLTVPQLGTQDGFISRLLGGEHKGDGSDGLTY